MKFYKKIIIVLSIILMIFGLSGCQKDDGSNRVMKYDVEKAAADIDPQFSTSETSKMIIANTFEGLFRYNQDGEIENVLAENWDVSANGKIYTFHIKKNVKWSNGEDLTAHDFEFAFKRMFDLQALSPFASNYISIKNAEKILNGEMKKETLGVKAIDDYTLRISLESPNPYFISLLTYNAAMPCNQDFLVKAKGRYGLDLEHLIFNGPFSVKLWADEEIRLRRNSEYYDKDFVDCAGVNFYVNRGNPRELFMDGKSDCCFVDEIAVQNLKKNMSYESFKNVTLQLIFNQDENIFQNEKIRIAMALALKTEKIEGDEFFSPEQNLIPSIINTPLGKYRDEAGNIEYPDIEDMDLKGLFDEGLKELGKNSPEKLTFIAPNDSAGIKAVKDFQRIWAKELSVYVNFELLEENELLSRIKKSDYQIALMPVTPADDSAIGVVSAFTSDSPFNYCNMNDEYFDELVGRAMHSSDVKASIKLLKNAEQYLIEKAAVVPIFSGKRYFASGEKVSGISVSIYEKTCFFKYAKRKD